MALGLGRRATITNRVGSNSSITLRELLLNPLGFPLHYIPELRTTNGVDFINTHAVGHDASDNSTVFYKWIFIDPATANATPDSDCQYAKIPKHGFIMRILQRAMLPYHENFVIDYYEDINAVRVVGISADKQNEFQNKMNRITRMFPSGDSNVPAELRQEIYQFPKEFFELYIKSAIPVELFYQQNVGSNKSNHISDYGTEFGNYINIGGRPRTPASPVQNHSVRPQPNYPAFAKRTTDTPMTIEQTGLHYRPY